LLTEAGNELRFVRRLNLARLPQPARALRSSLSAALRRSASRIRAAAGRRAAQT